MLIVSKSGHVGYKGLLCYILIKWWWVSEWVSDMINCRDAIASKTLSQKPPLYQIAFSKDSLKRDA